MWEIDYYMLPSQDYSAIDQTDIFMLDLIESRIDSEEQMIIPEEFYQKEDDNGVNAAEYLFGQQQNDISTFLYEIIGKKTLSAKTYEEVQQEENIGYVALQKEDVLKKEITVQNVCKNIEESTNQNDDLLKVRRYYMMQVNSYEQYIERIYKAFPNLLFHEDAFFKISKLGVFKDCVNELHRHLCTLNDYGKKLYFELNQKEEDVFAYLQSKYDIVCSGKGSNERNEFKLEFDGIKITCNPHTKFYDGYNDQRIYFCWGREEIDNHKMIIGRIGNHWDK